MEKKLLGIYKNEKATVRIWVDPTRDTQEKLRELFEPATIRFLKAIRERNPEAFNRLIKSTNGK